MYNLNPEDAIKENIDVLQKLTPKTQLIYINEICKYIQNAKETKKIFDNFK